MMGCTCSCNSCNHYPEGHKIPPAKKPAPIVTQPGKTTSAPQQGKPISKTKAINDGLDIAAKVKQLFAKSNKAKPKQKPTSKDGVKGGKGTESNEVKPGDAPGRPVYDRERPEHEGSDNDRDRNEYDDGDSDRVKTDVTDNDRDRQDYDDDGDREREKTNVNDNDRDRMDNYDEDDDDDERDRTGNNNNEKDRARQ